MHRIKRLLLLLICCSIALFPAGCGEKVTGQPETGQEEASSRETEQGTDMPAATEQVENTPATEEQDANESNEPEAVFELTEEEQAIFERYVESLDNEIFRDVAPVSIAKIYIQCGVDSLWEPEFSMYAKEGLTISREEYKAAHDEDLEAGYTLTRKAMADYVFPYLQDSEFVEDGGNKGHIDFEAVDGEPWTLRLIKSDTGIWEIKFLPFDEYE